MLSPFQLLASRHGLRGGLGAPVLSLLSGIPAIREKAGAGLVK